MLQCWNEQQQDRPDFSELRNLLDQFLTAYIQDHYPYIELQSSDGLVLETVQLTDSLNGSTNGSIPDMVGGQMDDGGSGLGTSSSPRRGGSLNESNGGKL